jgi:exodeoxyribonuclease V alpha subunit
MQLVFTVERVLYPKGGGKSDSGFYLLKGDANGQTVVCKGNMAWGPEEMETLALIGGWVIYKGEKQFKFNAAKLTLPMEPQSQLNYVCERTNGVGPALALAIWEHCGEKWRELKRGDIKKMSDAAFNNFQEQIKAFEHNKEQAEVVAWLESKGCTTAMASAAFEEWKKNAPGVVNNNCYRLAELSGFSFKSVDDRVRLNFGIVDDDPRRIKAAVIYALQQITKDGSTAVSWFVHLARIEELLPEVAPVLIGDTVKEMVRDGAIRIFPKQLMGALEKDYQAEIAIFEFVRTTLDAPPSTIDGFDEWISSRNESFTPDDIQVAAIRTALENQFCIISGGAGTGKTTIIKLIADGLKQFGNKAPRLAAFAGKAAARLREATGYQATTIHVLLGSRGSDCFTAGPLTNDAVIIDESSMVNAALMAEIVKRRPGKLILVGDQAQLSPVGAGQPFHDLIAILNDSGSGVQELKNCYRATEAVFQAATCIRNGQTPGLKLESDNEKWTIVGATKPESAANMICAWAKDDWLDFDTDIVLVPKNGKKDEDSGNIPACTVNSLNEELLLIDRMKRGEDSDDKFIPGDRIINTKNFAEDQVWNGTTGAVHAVNNVGEVFIKLDIPIRDLITGGFKDVVKFTKDMAKRLQHAYALTVHKSQGSQYRRVVIAVLSRDKFILDRSLVYTGVTRTKEECVVIGDLYALSESINTVKRKDTVLQLLYENEPDALDI